MTDTLSEHTLYTVEDLIEILNSTEDLDEYPFEYGRDNHVRMDIRPNAVGDKVFLKIGEVEYPMTRDSMEQVLKEASLPVDLLEGPPPELLLAILNWHLGNRGGSLKALLKGDRIVSFTKPSTEIYSSVEILESILKTLRDEYGMTDVLVQNPHHDLFLTQYTLILPQLNKQTETGEVLTAAITVTNSVLAKEPLVLWGGVARDYHFNSMISENTIEKWNRKKVKSVGLEDALAGEESYDVYDWLKNATINVFKNLGNDMVNVKRLQNLQVGSHAGTFLNSLFNKYSISGKLGGFIRESFSEQEGNTVYDLWNAVTESANHDELEAKPKNIRKLMQVGGALAAHPESCTSCHRIKEDLE